MNKKTFSVILSILLAVIIASGGIIIYSVFPKKQDPGLRTPGSGPADVTQPVDKAEFAPADKTDALPDHMTGSILNAGDYPAPEDAAAVLAGLGELAVNTVVIRAANGENDFSALKAAAEDKNARVVLLVEASAINGAFISAAKACRPSAIALDGFTDTAFFDLAAEFPASAIGAYVTSADDIPALAEFAMGEVDGSMESGDAKKIIDAYSDKVRETDTPVFAVLRCDKYFTPEDGYTDDIYEQLRYVYNSSLMSGAVMYSPDEILTNPGGEAVSISGYYNGFNTSAMTALDLTGFEVNENDNTLSVNGTGEKNFPAAVISTAGGVMEQMIGDDGAFSFTVPLREGRNTVTVRHKNAVRSYRIDRAIDVLTAHNAENSGNGRTLLTATALTGSSVFAECGNKVWKLSACGKADDAHTMYSAVAETPPGGEFVFTAVKNGIQDTDEWGADVGAASPYDDRGMGRTGLMCQITVPQAEAAAEGSPVDSSDPLCTPQSKGSVGSVKDIVISSGKPMYIISSGMQVYASDAALIVGGFASDGKNIVSFHADSDGRGSTIRISASVPTFTKVEVAPQEYHTDRHGRNYAVNSFSPEYMDVAFYDVTGFVGTSYSETGAGGLISSVRWLTPGDDGRLVLRLDLREGEKFGGYSLTVDETRSEYILKVFRTPGALSGAVIMLDPGHGGYSSTGAAWGDRSEKTAVLAMALELKGLLEARGATVIMTREVDRELSLEARTALERRICPDAFLSIHCDGADDKSARGATAYYYRSWSMPLAAAVNAELNDLYSTEFYPKGYTASQPEYYPFMVARVEECPSILVETGFITNEGDMKNLTSKEGQNKIATAIADALGYYFAGNPAVNEGNYITP
ncbi:MAG: N-acetylmuramoyl-L-alanine amidase [Clostridia bacterium]|nr:N-acetylmuramoyl-L-alanine amidase [Clostridia bacterium]